MRIQAGHIAAIVTPIAVILIGAIVFVLCRRSDGYSAQILVDEDSNDECGNQNQTENSKPLLTDNHKSENFTHVRTNFTHVSYHSKLPHVSRLSLLVSNLIGTFYL